MAEENALQDIGKNIEKFLVLYKILSSADKAAFEAQMTSTIRDVDEKTRLLYQSLLKSAKDNLTKEEALKAMHKARNA